jgi:transaldolase
MQLFLDTADEQQIMHWLGSGVVDGVTTNPTILRSQRWPDLCQGVCRLARLIAPFPLSVEVYSADADEMLEQSTRFASWADNVVVKIPVIGEHGGHYLDVVHTLESQGVRVNCTACLSYGQGLLAAKAGATYVSLLAGRIEDEGGDGVAVVHQLCSFLDNWQLATRVIVGSVRAPRDLQAYAQAGAHIITVSPSVLGKMVDHRYSRATVAQFTRDGREAFEAQSTTIPLRRGDG